MLRPSLVTEVARDLDEPDEEEDDEDGLRESVGNDGRLTRDSPPPDDVDPLPDDVDPPEDPPDEPDEDEPLVRGIAV